MTNTDRIDVCAGGAPMSAARTPLAFTYTALPARVVFGAGTLRQVAEEVERLGARRPVVLSTPPQQDAARALAASLGNVAVFAEAVMHTPVEVTDRAVAAVRDANADCLVAFGGGSTIGLGKAITLRTGDPLIAVPTTYAGSEATPILGQTEGGRKTTLRDMRVLPRTIVYDVELTLTLPLGLTVTSGLNAIAHAVEGLYARDANPVTSALAEQGIAFLASALPSLLDTPADLTARADALYGAWACGTVLGSVGMALHHKLCHVLGGRFDLPHAETHAILLPHVAAFNAAAAPNAMARIARALGSANAADGLIALARRLGAPLALRDIGMPENGVAQAADAAVANPYWNPRPVDRESIQLLLEAAFTGRWVGDSWDAGALAT